VHYAENTGHVLAGTTTDEEARHFRLTFKHHKCRYVIAAHMEKFDLDCWALFPADALGTITAWYQLGAHAPTLPALLTLHGYQER
jgi:hypothetical protein